MSKQREALEMALEAINSLWNIIDDIDTASDIAKFDDRLYRNQVESLQARRWRLDISTDGQLLIGKVINKIREAMAEQPEPKPVVWIRHENEWVGLAPKEHLPIHTPRPDARKPLTDDEIDTLADATPGDTIDSVTSTWHIRLARAIEKAHGIGEQ